ncbi:MAG TPA: hypothetical protein PKD90_17290, partial [Phnomibacter sp.]|nr:hypothetical protein [Phnomibacter sp.]
DMVLLDVPEDLPPGEWPTGKELQSKLYYLKKFSAGETAIEIIFMKALASGLNADKDRSRIEVQSRTPNTFKGIKVQVSLTGKLQQV